jgi:hypothetical protein
MDINYEVIDRLIFMSYRYNRLRSPDITPEQWGKVFSSIESLEKRFQEELSDITLG